MIPEEAKGAMMGAMPSFISSCGEDGKPNVAYLSQVWFVDDTHIAVSHQFFNKTARNIGQNPVACIRAVHPMTFARWVFDVRFDRSETEGALFDEMDMALEAIASQTGMSGVFKLKAADVYEVTAVRTIPMLGPFEGVG